MYIYIIAIGWAYVVLLMAATAKSFVAGVLIFIFYGLLPLALIFWLAGSRQRARNKECPRRVPAATRRPWRDKRLRQLAEERPGEPDRADPQTDQQHLL